MKRTTDASPARRGLAMSTKQRRRSATAALFAAALALLLALPSFASADTLGKVTLYSGARATAFIKNVTAASDGNVWFVDNGLESGGVAAVGKVTPGGTITEYISGTTLKGLNAGANLVAIATGPEGKLWLTDKGTTPAIGVIDPATCSSECEIKEFSIQAEGGNAGAKPQGIVAYGGYLWFADKGTTPAIGRIDPSTHAVAEFSIQAEGGSEGSQPHGIVASGGKLWFTDGGTIRAIGAFDPSAPATERVKEFATGENSEPGGGSSEIGPWGIAAGPDGNVWFTENGSESTAGRSAQGKAIGRITPSGTITYFSTGLIESSKPFGLTSAPDGKLWFTDNSGLAEKQSLTFSGATEGQKFKICNELKCSAEFEYKLATSISTRNTLISRVKIAYEAAYGTGNAIASTSGNCGGNCIFTIIIGELENANFAKANCEPVTAGGTCSTGTTTDGVPNAAGSITTSGTITRYTVNGQSFMNGITNGPDGNVWFSASVTTGQKLGKIGIGEKHALKVTETGTGSGTVTSEPTGINCPGDCEESYYEYQEVTLTAKAKANSKFEGWSGSGCSGTGTCIVTMSEAHEVVAEFKNTGPTNLRTLTLTKSAGGTGGTGTVQSKPKGIKCGPPCNEAVAELYANQTVVLKAKASTGSTIASWSGCESSTGVGGIEGTCTIKMPEAHVETKVKVAWAGTSKEILNPQALTVSKGESTGKGTVKGTGGLGCETECTETTVLYQGETGVEPKIKPGKTVVLKAASAFGSEFTGFSPNCTEITPTECSVVMNEAEEVTAEFALKPTTTLTVSKAGSGTGTVSSKPKAINCGTTCTTQDATVPEEEAVILKEKPGTEMTFTGWSGGGCSGTAETCTVSLSEAATVTATFSGSPKAIPNAKSVTLLKAGNGYGTVKAAGLTCEALCTSTASLYQGETGVEPKIKPGKTVIFKAISAPGSKTVVWSGCTEINPTECSVTVMNEDLEVTATFDELE